MSQSDKILLAMLKNKNKKYWTAKDFQYGENFIGYEATARMSELAQKYPDVLEVGKEGRFRTLAVIWKNKKKIKNIIKEIGG